ncbi:uncharacterized protein PV09_07809 [Verruconis gallopava]|uniref:Uncharacterized protein n=1 Tax=Verruconis gallopava TaxID=253628 RepID=A0A0D1YIE1_9PEZI|nr:uncharacterized protein PV09_07809 [Verruconis gallopava]KIW00612.1 hypothetical protein PV09_07809 [Verruconis gallopava]
MSAMLRRRAVSLSIRQIDKSATARLSLPNPRPSHVSPRLDELVKSRFLRCILYGVQDVSSTDCEDRTVLAKDQSSAETQPSARTVDAEELLASTSGSDSIPRGVKGHLDTLIDPSGILRPVVGGVQDSVDAQTTPLQPNEMPKPGQP